MTYKIERTKQALKNLGADFLTTDLILHMINNPMPAPVWDGKAKDITEDVINRKAIKNTLKRLRDKYWLNNTLKVQIIKHEVNVWEITFKSDLQIQKTTFINPDGCNEVDYTIKEEEKKEVTKKNNFKQM